MSWLLKFIILGGATLLLYYFIRRPERTALDVLEDLQDLYPNEAQLYSVRSDKSIPRTNLLKGTRSEILTSGEAADLASIKGKIILAALVATVIAVVVGVSSLPVLLMSFIAGAAAMYIYAGIRQRTAQEELIQEIEQMLPVVMERLVMAVQSGLDIVAALNTIVSLDEQEQEARHTIDPVIELLAIVVKLSESGLSFSIALKQVADVIPCVALRHAFVHLALAYEEGGELVAPLRELSDATQLYYQESVEERIAKLPVKATLPLVLTFAGLIIFFITTPLLQVMEVIKAVKLE